VVVNLQPFERLSKMLIGGVLTDFFSHDSGVVTGIQAGDDLDGNALVVEILPQDPTVSDDTFIEGDLDGDGLVSNADKDQLKDLTKPKSRPPTPDELMAGDLNGDDKLDAKDFVLLVQLLNGP